MRIPLQPPDVEQILRRLAGRVSLAHVLGAWRAVGPTPGGEYRHWDEFRYLPGADGFSAEERWALVKLARRQLFRPIPLTDTSGRPFQFAVPPLAQELLHHVDRDAAGITGAIEPVTNPQTQATYLLKSLVEEAIRSSQLEGASTTRRVAKDMILSGRAPRDRSERMILNNFAAMQYVRDVKMERLTPSRVLELQEILTAGTLDEPDGAGRLRRRDEHIVVSDEEGTVLHEPPPAEQLADRLSAMCDFANSVGSSEFMHPAVRAVLVHFWLAYDHPFVDGNGRTARALFYWIMARQGYWLCEYVSISRILKKARAMYARSFLHTESDDNDATYFILYQLRVLNRAIRELHAYLERKAHEIREIEDLTHRSEALRAELNERQLDLLTHALKHPNFPYTIASHRRAHEVAYGTARSDLLSLASLGLLLHRKRGRAFVFIAPKDLRDRLHGRKRALERR